MADTMQFDLVSPEKKLASVEATMVQLPGMDGDLTAMPNHAPLITTLRPGIVSVHAGGATTDYVVTGGFAELSKDGASVLAEEAMDKGDVTRENLEALAEEARAGLDGADDATKTALNQRINDLTMLIGSLGL